MVPGRFLAARRKLEVLEAVERLMAKRLEPIPPGEILLEEFMKPLGVSQNKLARDIDVSIARVNEVVHNKRGITADTALRFGTYFGTTAEFWINLQSRYDLKVVRASLGPTLAEIIRPLRRAEEPAKG
jgi:addiction module HigA family antidote